MTIVFKGNCFWKDYNNLIVWIYHFRKLIVPKDLIKRCFHSVGRKRCTGFFLGVNYSKVPFYNIVGYKHYNNSCRSLFEAIVECRHLNKINNIFAVGGTVEICLPWGIVMTETYVNGCNFNKMPCGKVLLRISDMYAYIWNYCWNCLNWIAMPSCLILTFIPENPAITIIISPCGKCMQGHKSNAFA